MTETLLVERDDGLATLTLNRPEALNALSSELREALVEQFHALAAEDEIGVVILIGTGRAFSAEVDLKEIGAGATPDFLDPRFDAVAAMDNCAQPIIGAINGFAVTGGFEVALACDLLIASPNAKFADTHARLGIVPGWGLSQRLPRLIGVGRAKEMSLSGNYVDAAIAEAWGLVNRVVPADALLDTARRLARDMLSCDRSAMLDLKRMMNEGLSATLGEGREIERWINRSRSGSGDIEARRSELQRRGREQAEN
jgi:enoyl-CoA hydratase